MAVKTKDFKINLSDFTTEGFEVNANKKTALRIEELTKSDLENNKLSFAIADNRLVITNTINDDKLIVKNYKNIKYIKTDVIGKKYNLFNIISNNVVDNLSDITKYNPKKRTMTGTNYNDTINAKLSDYIVPNTGKNKNKGLTIKGGSGNDTITGTMGNDTITGGSGKTVINYSKGDGNDVINLTKGENFTLNFTDLAKDDLRFVFVNKNKDLRIYTDKTLNTEYITIKNFVKKNVTNNSNAKKNIPDSSSVEIVFNNDETSKIDLRTAVDLYKKEITKNYTGSWLPETISAEDYIKYAWYKTEEGTKELFEVEDWSKKGLTIKAGGGDDTIIGSGYSDTIYGGDGDDIIDGAGGNNKLVGGKGNNTFICSYGNDTITDAKYGDIIKIDSVNSDDISFFKNGNNLEIDYIECLITVQNYFKSNNKIDRLIVADEEISITEKAKNYGIRGTGTIKGNDEDNTIESIGKNNVKIYAGKGNDTIYAGAKKTTVYFYEGDGIDTVVDSYYDEYSTSSINLVFQAGIKPSFSVDGGIKEGKGGYLYYVRNFIISYGESDKIILDGLYGIDTETFNKINIQIGNKTYKLNNYFTLPENIYNYEDNKTIDGTNQADKIIVGGNNNTVNAKDGSDNIFIDYHQYENNTINAGNGDDWITVEGTKNIINGDNGNDFVDVTYGWNNIINLGEGDDICRIRLDNSTDIIYDESGDNDKIILSGNNSYNNTEDNVVICFDLVIDNDGNIVEDLSKNMYIKRTFDFENEYGIKVVDQFVEGKAIETITTADNYVLTSSQINELRSDIAGWLHDNGFESVQQIIDSNNETNINNLITEFQKADWQIAS